MQTLTYTHYDRKALGWPSGPWDNEPDKVQWQDAATDLPCLAVRNHMGAWCGYVGVDKRHPLFGIEYDQDERATALDVHGGLTFSDVCQPGPESRSICHLPAEGEPDHVWWLGFDCGHGFDVIPQMLQTAPSLYRECAGISHPQYRTLSYVQEQCAHLAAQLHALQP